MSEEVLATVSASAPRRWMAVGIMGILGALLLYIAMTTPPAVLGWQVFLIVLGIVALVFADKTRRATERVVELTAQGLRDSTGTVIAPLADIDRINRGMFAMKPSNGFTLVLKHGRDRSWQPGLWWAIGKRVGIGGVTPGSQTKFMAQMLEAMVAEARAQDDQTS
ncbi:hypothetical protein [Shimia sediminis]|uniref:hypothetical protein n=1 Tax=Shimia sediminis TaxID=2497945 RepID=UPI000F8DCDDE|nr:hypothetical protein [Shimia sediminis]